MGKHLEILINFIDIFKKLNISIRNIYFIESFYNIFLLGIFHSPYMVYFCKMYKILYDKVIVFVFSISE
jgi:hypothetical protein